MTQRVLPGLAGECRARAGLSARHQPPGKRTAFPRPDAARLWRRQHHAHHAGDFAGHRRRAVAARAGRAAVHVPHERRPRGVSHAGIDPRKNGRAAKPSTRRMAATKQECHFTTHTPVEAGHDRFTPELMDYALQQVIARTRPCRSPEFMALGRVNPTNAEAKRSA